MIKRLFLLTTFLTFFSGSALFSQAKLEIRNMFYEAEMYILFEDYKEALPSYARLLTFFPSNSNLKYRLGQCYLNKPGEKDKAIGYLEDAVMDINPSYKEGKFKETRAPYDALYYLANAYRINNQLDKAIETYELFKLNLNTKIYDPEVVEEQIQSCLHAKELINTPLFIRAVNLGSVINDTRSEFNPVISEDEKIMVFAQSLAFYDAILYSEKSNGSWSGPVNLNEALQIDRDIYPTSISRDGKTLYFYSSIDYDGSIYTSTLENGVWGQLVKLNEKINTKYWESHATISHDNRKLYFTSNRKNSLGGLDIYVSERDTLGDWGEPVNLGPVINTKYHEETPFLSKDDKTLFFSSRGHYNMGGYDIFYSTLLDNGEWSVPLNAGYPLNSTDDDVFYRPINDGYEGYLAKFIPGNFGEQDIYRIEIFSDEHPRKFTVRGVVTIADLHQKNIDSRIKVSALNTGKPDQLVVVYSNPQTGEYELQLPQGNFEVTYEGAGGERVQRNLELALMNPSDSIVIPGTILPRSDFVAELTVDSENALTVAKGDTIIIPVKAEPGSVLVVEHWLGDSLLYTESFPMTDSTFYYKAVPQVGDNKLTFRVTDKYSNTTTADVFITRKPDEAVADVVRPEYERVISEKQISALTEMQKNRAGDDLKKVISDLDFGKYDFAKVDDQIAFLKEEAMKRGVSGEEVDKLALEIALRDNVLSQAAVDYLARNVSDPELKKLLSGIDIYEMDLKTWNDLQDYIAEKTGGKTGPGELDRIAAAILAPPDVTISTQKEKLLALEDDPAIGSVVKQAISATEKKGITDKGAWLKSVYQESVDQGLADKELARLLASVSSLPGTTAGQFRNDLAAAAEEPFRSWLNSIDLKKEGIRTPEELILFILKNMSKAGVEESFFKALASLINSINIPVETIKPAVVPEKEFKWWILWLLLGAGVLFCFIIWYRRRNKDKKKE